ncbi:MAG: hypothetical protein KGS48_03515 [Bacteroidetes bacterium]|nr:hypothetical protein [Bacteroidota bacterium]
MPRISSIWFGPELCWLAAIACAAWLAYANKPSGRFDGWIENCAYLAPLIALGTFAFFLMPNVPHSALLLRIWIAALIGCHYFLNTALQGYSTQGPGIGTAYLVGFIYVFVALLIGTIWVLYRTFTNPG